MLLERPIQIRYGRSDSANEERIYRQAKETGPGAISKGEFTPDGGTADEVVLHVPHASLVVPSGVRRQLLVADDLPNRELLRLTDRYTDDLSALGKGAAVIAPVSRLVADMERFEDDEHEPMNRRGMGVIYEKCFDAAPLRVRPDGAVREDLLSTYYRPHHVLLELRVRDALDRWDRCILIDCHSFPSRPLPCDLNQTPHRPDICLGTDSYDTPPSLLEAVQGAFERQGWSVWVNKPYAGALVPKAF